MLVCVSCPVSDLPEETVHPSDWVEGLLASLWSGLQGRPAGLGSPWASVSLALPAHAPRLILLVSPKDSYPLRSRPSGRDARVCVAGSAPSNLGRRAERSGWRVGLARGSDTGSSRRPVPGCWMSGRQPALRTQASSSRARASPLHIEPADGEHQT